MAEPTLKDLISAFSTHLKQLLENPPIAIQTAYLRDFAHNITEINKLIHSLQHSDYPTLKETAEILGHIFKISIRFLNGTTEMTLVEAAKNYKTPSTRESDLCKLVTALERFPESTRVMIQELDLLIAEL